MQNERQWIEQAQRGESGAFDQLYHAYVDQVHRQLARVVGPDADLDDLIQQTFILVFRNLDRYRGDARFSTWLYRIAYNVALMHLRRRRAPWVTLDDDFSSRHPGPDAEVQTETRQGLRRVDAVLNKLTPNKRLAYVLYELEGHTLDEIAELTGCSINTVAARVRQARVDVRRQLERPDRPATPRQALARA